MVTTLVELVRKLEALGHEVRVRALDFSRQHATRLFSQYLVPAHGVQLADDKGSVTNMSSSD